jgi:uncharacterized cupredoxin-like copper-binding protein
MNINRRTWVALATGLVASAGAGPALAAGRSIKVSLWDTGAMAMQGPGAGPMMGMGTHGGGPMGAPGRRMHMAHMGVKLSSNTVPAGMVTFDVRNDSKVLVHEMVISPIKDTRTPLPYDKAQNKVDEDAAGHMGEVAELEPGKSGGLTLELKRGRYILYCNVVGHYAQGMWTVLTVT